MPQYLSPGVYVEEVPSASAPIAGVNTSIAGFIGVVDENKIEMPPIPGKFKKKANSGGGTNGGGTDGGGTDGGGTNGGGTNGGGTGGGGTDGGGGTGGGGTGGGVAPPIVDEDGNELELDNNNEPIPERYEPVGPQTPKLVTSWAEFRQYFGNLSKGKDGNRFLAHAVYGFFNNGGSRCWVTAIPTAGPTDVQTALEGFEAIDEITMVAVPGETNKAVQSAVVDHCKKMNDRFAIIDSEKGAGPGEPNKIQLQLGASDYAALYYPWIQVFDPITEDNQLVPPSGHMAGIYARVDTERGVHKAPANVDVRGALDVERRISKPQQDGLNPIGINCIRRFNGSVKVWGARTLGGNKNGEWKYINVRRLFLFLRESIDEGTQGYVFEPNDAKLWAKITLNVSAFLTGQWRNGALFGGTPGEAFYVKCDAETNPPDVIDQGQVVTEIGVAVVKPAEFVIFRISQKAGTGA